MEAERRRAGQRRFPLRVPTLAAPVAVPGSVSAGLTQNLSRGGMLLQWRQEGPS
jgi:hypothetical protein